MPMMMGGSAGWTVLFWGVIVLVGLGWVVRRSALAKPRPDGHDRPASDPLALARERYAQGLITKQEFEDVVHQLLNTEHPDD